MFVKKINKAIGPRPKKKRLTTTPSSNESQTLVQEGSESSAVKNLQNEESAFCGSVCVKEEDIGQSLDGSNRSKGCCIKESELKEEYEPQEHTIKESLDGNNEGKGYDIEDNSKPEEEHEPEEDTDGSYKDKSYGTEEIIELEQDVFDQSLHGSNKTKVFGMEESDVPEEEYEPGEDTMKKSLDWSYKGKSYSMMENEPQEDNQLYFEGNEFEHIYVHEGDESDLEADCTTMDENEKRVNSFGKQDIDNMVNEGDKDEDVRGDEELPEIVDAGDEEYYEDVMLRHKQNELEVFVRDLDEYTTENDIKKVFGKVGKITNIKLMTNPSTNKTFAFLRFASQEQTKRVLRELRNPVVNGKQCNVHPCKENYTLFLGNICKRWTKGRLEEKLKHFGVDKFVNLTLVGDINNIGINCGFAFLRFLSHFDAMFAYKRLQKRDVVLGCDRSAKVSFAYPSVDSNDEIITQVKLVFLDGIPASWDEVFINRHLRKFGKIEKIELARNKPSAKRIEYGYVTFSTHDAAVKCAEAINDAEFSEKDNKVNVRANLPQPLQRRNWKHLVRGNFPIRNGPGSRSEGSKNCDLLHGISMQRTKEIRPSMESSDGYRRRSPVGYRNRQPSLDLAGRSRPLPAPLRSHDKKPRDSSHFKRSMDEYHGRQSIDEYHGRQSMDEYHGRQSTLPLRGKTVTEHSYRVGRTNESEYSSWRSRNSVDMSRRASRSGRSLYVDEGFEQRFAGPPSDYHMEHHGSKRHFSAVDYSPCSVDVNDRVFQSRTVMEYGSRVSKSYKSDYPCHSRRSRNSIDVDRRVSSSRARSMHVDEGFGHRYASPPSDYRIEHYRSEYHFPSLDDSPSSADYNVCRSRTFLDYEIGESDPYNADVYGDRHENLHPTYASNSRSYPTWELPPKLRCSSQGSIGDAEADRMHSLNYADDYQSPVNGSSYSSLYYSRGSRAGSCLEAGSPAYY